MPVRPTVPPRRVDGEEMVVTWIGHATVLVQTAGLNILTDPVWSDRVSPFSFAGPRRHRQPGVRFEDLPRIDLVLVSHNHYDHLDLPTLRRLWERDRPLIVTGLGNDTIMRREGIEATARDWGERVPVRPGVEVVMARNYHWTSRWLTDRNRALWTSFAVRTPSGAIFFAGDTGFGDGSWVREAAAHGPYRLAILPIGAYAPREVMRNSHINPGEAMAIFDILRPNMALGVHWGTFQLSWEEIDAPPRALAALRRARGMPRGRFVVTEVGQSFRVPPLAPLEDRPQAPQFGEGALGQGRGEIFDPRRAARALLEADHPLDGDDMLVPPDREGVVDIDQLLGELVEAPVIVGVPIDLRPGRLDRRIGPVGLAPVPLQRARRQREAAAGERHVRLVPQARPLQRIGERRMFRRTLAVAVEMRALPSSLKETRPRGTGRTGSRSTCRARRGR